MQKFLRHARHNVVAYMALFVALGGTSYAAVKLSANSVGTRELKNGAVTGAKVRAHTLQGIDFAAGVLRQGATGATGAAGATGPQGPAGPAGGSSSGLWAVINSFGVKEFGSHVQGTSHFNGTGFYTVSFDQSVNGCAMVAQVGGYKRGGDQQAIPTGFAAAGSDGDGNPTALSTVDVVTRDGTGASADRPFHLIVSC